MRKITAIFLAVTMLVLAPFPMGAAAEVYAADYDQSAAAEIVKAIDAYVTPYLGTNSLNSYQGGKAKQCHAFVNYVWKNVFGCDLYSGKSSTTPSSKDYSQMGAYVNQYGRPGDILRVDRQHSMIITAIDEDGVHGYDWIRTRKEQKRYYSWEQVKDWGSGAESYWLYQVDDSIYNSFSTGEVQEPAKVYTPPEIIQVQEDAVVSRGSADRLGGDGVYKRVIALQIDNPLITLNGIPLALDVSGSGDVAAMPLLVEGRTLLPIRAVVESMGGKVEWVDETRATILTYNDTVIQLTLGSTLMLVDGKNIQLDVAPVIIHGRTMLPIRPIIEAFGGEVLWEQSTRTINILF